MGFLKEVEVDKIVVEMGFLKEVEGDNVVVFIDNCKFRVVLLVILMVVVNMEVIFFNLQNVLLFKKFVVCLCVFSIDIVVL